MPLPPNFLDELRARTPLVPLIGRRVRLTRSGRDQKGCCPFHNEKSPSFHVYDDHFHCFGCGAHGDAISFVMQSEGAGFMEAVERLAVEAGLSVPKPTPEAAEVARRDADLSDILDLATSEYQRRLQTKDGAAALGYLRGRGLSDSTIARFGLGWSGASRGSLLKALEPRGIAAPRLVEAGLMKQTDSGPVDYFYARVMFPIRDRRGRVISFGGRLLGDGQPKYLNGPETALFSKRQTLYGIDTAREAVRKGAALIVVEGYMDVIALAEAGFPGAVAPLGTALTEAHLVELWRLSPRPLLCFDGDAAGRRATLRSIELALPALKADRSMGVVRLTDGEDPDSFVRKFGSGKLRSEIDNALPVREALFAEITSSGDRKSPEGQAAMKERLTSFAKLISDKALANGYVNFFSNEFFERVVRTKGKKPLVKHTRPLINAETVKARRTARLTAILLHHPTLLPDLEEAFGKVDLPDDYARIRDSMATWFHSTEALDSDDLLNHLTQSGLRDTAEQLRALIPQRAPGNGPVSSVELETSWYGIYGLINQEDLRIQCEEQRLRFEANPTTENNQRHLACVTALRRIESGEPDNDAVF